VEEGGGDVWGLNSSMVVRGGGSETIHIACTVFFEKCTGLDLSPLYILIIETYQTRTEKHFPSARRLLPAEMHEHWPHVCRDKITFELLRLPTKCFVSSSTTMILLNSPKMPF